MDQPSPTANFITRSKPFPVFHPVQIIKMVEYYNTVCPQKVIMLYKGRQTQGCFSEISGLKICRKKNSRLYKYGQPIRFLVTFKEKKKSKTLSPSRGHNYLRIQSKSYCFLWQSFFYYNLGTKTKKLC